MSSWSRAFFLLLLALLLGGCASGGVPVLDLYSIYSRNQPATQPVTRGSHKVERGETLYSIAFRYGWNFHDLARANGIHSPYTIYPGQMIHFDRRPSVARSTTSSTSRQSSVSRQKQPTRAPRAAPKPKLAAGQPRFVWPSSGAVLSHYGSAASAKGINLGGAKGAKVVAAAAGIVVYRGHGLTGYGNLLIIKHNDDWLSAYAHNHTMLVQEGEQVKAGQQIATLGSSGTFRLQLYFEIRKDGRPVNPESYLPKR